jgi:Leucine-rich repeat (LRR) protein
VDASNLDADKVVEEDLQFFTALKTFHGARNSLPLHSLSSLPTLQELALPCNGLREIPNLESKYTLLVTLDLSYNAIHPSTLRNLAALPSLEVLDLTCNSLRVLPGPEVMGQFAKLEKLSLERNQIENSSVFVSLSALPRLRELSLGFNYIDRVPAQAVEGFPSLQTLSLAYNYISAEQNILPVARLHKLELLMLYGNPLMGPSGEDPTGESIVNVAQACFDVRSGFSTRALEILTEIPRKRSEQAAAGAPLQSRS